MRRMHVFITPILSYSLGIAMLLWSQIWLGSAIKQLME